MDTIVMEPEPIDVYPTLEDDQFDILKEELYTQKINELHDEYEKIVQNREMNVEYHYSDTDVISSADDKNGFSYRYHTLEMLDDEMNDICFDDFDDDDYRNVVLIEEEDEDDDTDDEYNGCIEYDEYHEYSDIRRSRQYSYI